MIEFKAISEYNRLKKSFNRHYNFLWKRIQGADYVGMCTHLVDTYRKKYEGTECSLNGFWKYYSDESISEEAKKNMTFPNSGMRFCGRTEEQLRVLARKYLNMIEQQDGNKDGKTEDDCLNDIFTHVIIETWFGAWPEWELMRLIEEKNPGYYVERQKGDVDKNCGIDLIVFKDKNKKEVKSYIQVKPKTTFFNNNRNASLVEDRVKFFGKEEYKKEWCKSMGYEYKETIFVLYDNESENPLGFEYIEIDGKKCFRLDQLSTRSGVGKLLCENGVFSLAV